MLSFTRKKQIIPMGLMLAILLLSGACESPAPQNQPAAVQKPKDSALAVFVVGQVSLTRQNQASRPLKAKEPLFDGDLIETGKGAHLSLQVRQDMVVKISPLTKARIFLEEPGKSIQLDQGETLVKLSGLPQGESFQVRTPTVVAGVRGTQFLTRYEKNVSTVAVGSGKVLVTQSVPGKTQEVYVTPGMAADQKETLATRKTSSGEEKKLTLLQKLPLAENPQNLSDEKLNVLQKEIQKIIQENEKPGVQAPQEEEIPLNTLEGLRKKFGRIDLIKLYNGRTIKGVILKRGDSMKILTPDGEVSVPAKSVQSTEVLPE